MAFDKASRRKRIQRIIRTKVAGTSERPRLSVFRSNTGIYAQIIDDTTGHTLASASSKHVSVEGGNGVDGRQRGAERMPEEPDRHHGEVRDEVDYLDTAVLIP